MDDILLEISIIRREGERAASGGNTILFQEIFCTLPLISLEESQHWLRRSACRELDLLGGLAHQEQKVSEKLGPLRRLWGLMRLWESIHVKHWE